MLKRIIKAVTVAVTIVCLVVCLIPVQALAVDPGSAIALAGALDAYGQAYGIGTVYDVTSTAGITDSFNELWDEFSTYQSSNNHGLPSVNGVTVNYDDYIDEWQTNYKSLHGFAHSSGNFAAWSIDSESAEVFDQFWDWLLTGPAEMTRVDNEYFQFSQNQIGDSAVPISVQESLSVNSFPGQPIPKTGLSSSKEQSFLMVGGSTGRSVYVSAASTYTVYVCLINYNGNYRPVAISYGQINNSACRFKAFNDGYSTGDYANTSISTQYQNTNWYYSENTITQNTMTNYNWPWNTMYSTSSNVPVYSDIAAAIYALNLSINPVVTDSVGVKSNTDDGISTLPNPYAQNYVPVPLEIITSIPWDDTYNPEDDDNGVPVPWTPSAVPGVVDDIGSAIQDSTYEIVEEDEEPLPPAQEVLLPFIPVRIPSFNFNFSGIWHYVREWVSSLASWFTTLFSIWSVLPYAMVVPVYATAVVVIVLGVYKRFFM